MGLVTELAVILVAAGVFTVLSKALKQPLILGYIIAGFIVSPHLGLVPEFGGTDAVKEWSDIGIIFLLFALGLEFSFKKLLKVGSTALIIAGTICVGMFIVGITAANAMGWTMMEGVFLGGLMSMSSTTIIIKTYDEMGLKNRPYAPMIFGTLVVEDLIAVLLMVLLSTLAVSNKFEGGQMIWSLAKLSFYIILWFVCGIYLIPTVLSKCRKWLNDEILVVFAIGLCFAMVALANAAGFSSALGAFVMGSILSETLEGERISRLMVSIKDVFGAIFFVSVGMMVDPSVIVQHSFPILLITLIAMGGLLITSSAGVLLAGKGLDAAVHTGFTMAQLGEFAFIIASLGTSLGVMRDFIYPVIITVFVITSFTTPFMIKAADPVYDYLQRQLPPKVLSRLSPKDDDVHGSIAERSEWKNLLKHYITRVVIYGVIIIAVLLLTAKYLEPLTLKILPDIGPVALNIVCCSVTLILLAPLMYGMSISNGSINAPASKLLHEKPSNRWPILSLMVFRIALSVFVVTSVLLHYFTLKGWALLLLIVAAAALLFVSKFTMRRFSNLEEHFLRNFNEKEEEEKRLTPVASSVNSKLATFNVHTQQVVVSPDFAFIGKTLREMPFRKDSEVNIIKIDRGTSNIVIPSGDEPVYPGDKLLCVGTDAQIRRFLSIMNENVHPQPDAQHLDFTVENTTLTETSYMTGKTLRELAMRTHGCMTICVWRNEKLITNPHAEFLFCAGDVVWLAGEKESCKWYM